MQLLPASMIPLLFESKPSPLLARCPSGDAFGIARFSEYFSVMAYAELTAGSESGIRKATVMLVDDHVVVRAGYKRYIELDPSLRVAAEAGSGEETYTQLERVSVDVVIMDLSMPGQGGFESLRRILNRYPAQRVLIFSMHENAAIARQALRLGTCGYLIKSMAPDEIIDAIHQAMCGARPVAPALRAHLAESDMPALPRNILLPPEFEIFIRLANGESIRKTCDYLNLSEKTAFNYQSMIRKRLNFGSGLELQ